jgi:hypothetical protein
MTYRPQSGPKHGSSKQFSKSAHDKKAKEKKQRAGARYLQQETPEQTPQEATEKTIGYLTRLGTQIFALSPFSQYFDDWLVNLKQVISEYESNPAIKTDEQFSRESNQIFLDVEGALAEARIQESNLTSEAKALAENNHRIVEADKYYAEKTRELSNKRNSELQRLNDKIQELEAELEKQQEIKISFFNFSAKRKAAEKLTQTKQNLKNTKNELELALQNFPIEQEKLHDNYEKKKYELNEVSDRLHRELERLETDTSTAARQKACNQLSESINTLLKRTMPTS